MFVAKIIFSAFNRKVRKGICKERKGKKKQFTESKLFSAPEGQDVCSTVNHPQIHRSGGAEYLKEQN
jgi:hypothetical protein